MSAREFDEIGEANHARYADACEVETYLVEPYHARRVDIALQLLRQSVPAASRVLEVGSATGTVARRIAAAGYSVVASDFESALLPTENSVPSLTSVAFDVRNRFPFGSDEFAGLMAGEIIEHLFDPLSFLRECRRVLAPGGYLVLTTPNLAGLQDRVMFCWGRSPRHVDPLHDYLRLHIRPFTSSMLRAIVTQAGFQPGELRSNHVVLRFGDRRIRSGTLARLAPGLGGTLILGARA